jgi:hypothetical protein
MIESHGLKNNVVVVKKYEKCSGYFKIQRDFTDIKYSRDVMA